MDIKLFIFLSQRKMTNKPVVSYHFVDLSADKQALVKDIVQKNLEGKMDSYFKKIYANKETAEIRVDYSIVLNKQGKFQGDFKFNFDGKSFKWSTGESGFKILEDVVNHAFEHFKMHLSK